MRETKENCCNILWQLLLAACLAWTFAAPALAGEEPADFPMQEVAIAPCGLSNVPDTSGILNNSFWNKQLLEL